VVAAIETKEDYPPFECLFETMRLPEQMTRIHRDLTGEIGREMWKTDEKPPEQPFWETLNLKGIAAGSLSNGALKVTPDRFGPFARFSASRVPPGDPRAA